MTRDTTRRVVRFSGRFVPTGLSNERQPGSMHGWPDAGGMSRRAEHA